MSKSIVTVLGVCFLIAGFVGLAYPYALGMHLSFVHNVVHLVVGALALSFGLTGTYKGVKAFSFIFGIIYGVLGIVGLMAPPGVSTLPLAGYDSHLLVVSPNLLEYGAVDSIGHLIVGIVFLIAAAIPTPFNIESVPKGKTPTISLK